MSQTKTTLTFLLLLTMVIGLPTLASAIVASPSCLAAKDVGKITASIQGNTATITNNGDSTHIVTVASYYKKETTDVDSGQQPVYDSKTVEVAPRSTKHVNVNIPQYHYQIDVICGELSQNTIQLSRMSPLCKIPSNDRNGRLRQYTRSTLASISKTQGLRPYPEINNHCPKDCRMPFVPLNDCVAAKKAGLISASIVNGKVTVTNRATEPFLVSAVSYNMFAPIIEGQTVRDYESVTLAPESITALSIDVPPCAYQFDLVCGKPILAGPPQYGDKVIAVDFQNQNNFCTPMASSSSPGISTALSIAPSFPQGPNYSFTCTANGFNANQYYWIFGDGQILTGVSNSNVFHTYAPGTYTPSCTATDGTHWATGIIGPLHVN